MVEMRYQYEEEIVEESGRTNVVIAAYTTAQASIVRNSVFVPVVVTSPVVRTSVLVPVVFTSPLVRTSVLVHEGCTKVLTTELNKNLGINNDVLITGLPPRL
jgi:hypothetical protein